MFHVTVIDCLPVQHSTIGVCRRYCKFIVECYTVCHFRPIILKHFCRTLYEWVFFSSHISRGDQKFFMEPEVSLSCLVSYFLTKEAQSSQTYARRRIPDNFTFLVFSHIQEPARIMCESRWFKSVTSPTFYWEWLSGLPRFLKKKIVGTTSKSSVPNTDDTKQEVCWRLKILYNNINSQLDATVMVLLII